MNLSLWQRKGSLSWKALCTPMQGCLFALAGKASDAVQRIASGIAALRSTGTTLWMPLHSSYFARAYAELGQFDDAWRSIGEGVTAVETTKATWFEAEADRIAGEIATMSPEPDAAKAEPISGAHLPSQASNKPNPGQLRAAMSLARLWREQGKPSKRADCLLRVCTAGSPKASTHAI